MDEASYPSLLADLAGIDPRLSAGEAIDWILEHLGGAEVCEAERAGEPLLVFSHPVTERVPGRVDRVFRIVGEGSGLERGRLTLGWATDDDDEVQEAERTLDAICLMLRLALNGRQAGQGEGEALGLLMGRPLLRCRHCGERAVTVAEATAHLQDCAARRRAGGPRWSRFMRAVRHHGPTW